MRVLGLLVVMLAAMLAVWPVAAAPSDIRINSGAGAFTDTAGDVWLADQFFTGGSTFATTSSIQNTADDTLYQSERFGNLVYNIPIANGNYGVELRFAEIFFNPSSPGSRIFNVTIEGTQVLVNFNILNEVGNNTALSRFFNTTVSDGSLQLRFATIVDNAKISAIRIYNLSGSPPPSNSSNTVVLYQMPGQITLLGAGPVGTIRSTSVNIPDDVSTALSAELRYDGYDIDAAAECLVRVNGNAWLNCGPNYTDNTYTADKNTLTPAWLITGSNLVEYQFASNLGGLTGGFNVKNVTLAVSFPGGSPPPPPPPPVNASAVYRINAGGPAFTDTSGDAWLADQFFTGGTTFANANNIQNTLDDTLYRSERYGNFVYNLPIANGNYGVELRFAEIFFNPSSPGPRIFNVTIEGTQVLVNFNILNEVGNNAALSKFFNTTVSDGSLQLRFATVADNAKISAIRIYNLGGSPPPPPPPPPPPTNVSVVYRINAGGPAFTDVFGNAWGADTPFANTGNTFTALSPIKSTDIDTMFQSERYDVVATPELTYALPVPNGQYEILLHFAEVYSGAFLPGQRVFDVMVENQLAIDNLDVAGTVGPNAAYSFMTTKTVSDGVINITLLHGVENPKISGIEVVPASGSVQLFKNVSSIEFGTLLDPVRESGNLSFLLKNSGNRTLIANIIVNGSDASSFRVHAPSSIILSPNEGLTVLAQFSPLTEGDKEAQLVLQSNDPSGPQVVALHGRYEVVGSEPPPINWTFRMIRNISNPSSIAFGPDERLYVASSDGIIEALTLNSDGDVIDVQNITAIYDLGLFPNTFGSSFYRSILGIGFNPLENSDDFAIYVSHSPLYTPDYFPGKVSKLRKSTNFTLVEDVVTGLPVSDHDHAVNGLEFLDNGNLLIAVGGNSDGGVPHSTFGNRDETPLSAAILEVNLSKSGFNGTITYDQTTDLRTTNQVSGDVSVFVSGMRNPYRVELHTNGNLYGTDNGPGFSNGVASIDCDTNATQAFNNMRTPDELNLIERGRYYGHPDRNRGRFDVRQCTYWNSSQPDAQPLNTAPISTMQASTDGIIDYRANTFGGELRGNLILSRLRGNVQRVVLSPDGRSVISHTELYSTGGLDVTEGPDGSLYFARHPSGRAVPPNNEVEQLKPLESPGTRITSVFPNRGPRNGGNSVLITGVGFIPNAGLTSVTFDGNSCAITSISSTQIRCALSAGTPGNTDLTILNSGTTLTLPLAYHYMDANSAS